MDKIVHLSLTRKSVPTRIDVVQYATKPNIVFVLDDYSIPDGATVSLYIKKPDDTEIFNYCEFEDNQITYTPTTQSFAVLGTSKCQLQIVESDGTAVSFLIYADVTENIIDSSAIESQDEFTALEEALQTVSDYDGRITSNTNRLDNLGDEHVTFEEATTDTTISDNLTLSTIFGRIKHLFTRTKALEDTHVEKVSPATVATVDCFPSGNPPQRVRLNVKDNNDNSYRAIFSDGGLSLWHDQASSNVWKMGSYHTGTQITTTVPSGTQTNVMSLTLPAGIYVIMSTIQFTDAFNDTYSHEVRSFSTDLNGDPIQRLNSTRGGGSVITVVAKLTAQRTIYTRVHQSSGSNKTLNRLNFTAVRIM